MTTLTIDIIAQFAAYYADEPVWGCLHIVLDEGNVNDGHVVYCLEYATQSNDVRAVALCQLLSKMSKSQRSRLPRKVREYLHGQLQDRPALPDRNNHS